MQTGKVVSASDQKQYGFIKGDDNVSYFFHYSKLDSNFNNTISIGELVKFDAEPGPKGMKAINVQKTECYPYHNLPVDFIITKKSSISKNQILVVSKPFHAESRNYNNPVNTLKAHAIELGCNAILGLTYNRRTVSDWYNPNYKYSKHSYDCSFALVGKEEFTTDENFSDNNIVEINQRVQRIRSNLDNKACYHFDDSQANYKPLILILGIIFFMLLILNIH